MPAVRLFLRAPLFCAGEAHVPPAAFVVEGELLGTDGGGFTVRATQYRSEAGRVLDGTPRTLFVPLAKIDHALHLEG